MPLIREHSLLDASHHSSQPPAPPAPPAPPEKKAPGDSLVAAEEGKASSSGLLSGSGIAFRSFKDKGGDKPIAPRSPAKVEPKVMSCSLTVFSNILHWLKHPIFIAVFLLFLFLLLLVFLC